MPIVAATQHAPFPPSGGNVYNAAVTDALSALDSVSAPSTTTKYDGIITVSGSNLINGVSQVVQLRGCDLEGPVDQPYFHNGNTIWGYDQPTGGPNAANFDAWKFNVVRLGINEATWNNYTTYAEAGANTTWPTPDPYGFRAQLASVIANFNSRGYYVILVLGWAQAGRLQVGDQLQHMANQDNSLTFWRSVADYFGYPGGSQLKRNGGIVDNQSVLFELCNEPQYYENDTIVMAGGLASEGFYYRAVNGTAYLCNPYQINAPTGTFIQGETVTSGSFTGTVVSAYQNAEPLSPNYGQWALYLSAAFGGTLANGSTITGSTSGATAVTTAHGWYVAGHRDLLRAVRASVGVGTVGCGTPCLLSSSCYNQYLAGFAAAAIAAGVTDTTAPVNWVSTYGAWTPQIAATWHPYPYALHITAAAINTPGTGYACASGTVGSGTTTSMTDLSASWTPHQWKNGMFLNVTTGKFSRVSDNTNNTLTFYSYPSTTAPASGNSYTVGDCINLPMDESGGASSNSVYWQAQLMVTAIGTGGAITAAQLCPCWYGIPGGNGGADLQTGTGPSGGLGGTYLNALLPTNPVGQAGPGANGSTTGVGTGANFNLTFSSAYQSGWPDEPTWPAVVTLKNTFNSIGIPIVITETAEHSGNGIAGSPWIAAQTAWADANGVSILPFSYGPVPGFYNQYGQDNHLDNGTDTPLNYNPGYGQFVYNWSTTHAP